MRLKAADGDLPFHEIVTGCEKVAAVQGSLARAPDIRTALGFAEQSNLLVSGRSAGYPTRGVGVEVEHAVYAVALNSEVEALLGSRAAGGGGATAEQLQVMKALLGETPFLGSPAPMRANLTDREFYLYLREPRTLREIIYWPEFFENGQPSFLRLLATSIEEKLLHAEIRGLIKVTRPPTGRDAQYVLTVAAQELLRAEE